MTTSHAFAGQLRAALGARPVTWLSRRSGLPHSTVSELLNEEIMREPRASTIIALARALSVSSDSLLGLPALAQRPDVTIDRELPGWRELPSARRALVREIVAALALATSLEVGSSRSPNSTARRRRRRRR